jgi:hypothetical protein
MKRGTVIRIVGFISLAFAAVSIYQGEFGVADTEVVITRAHDAESFWQGVMTMIAVGCASLYLSRVAGRPSSPSEASLLGRSGDVLSSSQPVDGYPELPNYNSDFCGKVVKGAACICVGLILVELAVLLLVHPSDNLCPRWTFILMNHRPLRYGLWREC